MQGWMGGVEDVYNIEVLASPARGSREPLLASK